MSQALADVGVSVLDCEHKTPAAQPSGFPYIAIPDIQDGRVLVNQARLISEADLAEWTRRTTPGRGDILVTRRGRVGDTAPIPDGLRCAIGQNLVLLRSDGTLVDQAFLRWAVRSPQWWSEVDRLMNVGAVFSSLNVKDIARIRLDFPPLPEQQAIAEVLGALDDKIAANTALAATQREIARARWDAHRRGVKTVPLGDLVETGLSGVWGDESQTPSAGTEVLALRGRDLEDVLVGKPLDAPHRWISSTQATRRIAPDALEVWTAGSGTLGPTLLITPQLRRSLPLPLTYSNFVKRLVAREDAAGHLPSAWFAIWEDWERGNFENYRTGTAMPNLDVSALLAGVQVPLLAGSERADVRAWADLILRQELEAENRTLAATRDALLPQLMSGRLRVRDAEAAASAAGA
ncbi:restriction endonuclease subunit S [Agromyces sp. NPDC058484]|uniref:restriction endonuclease subunit S n=1 Tax=Agromyces sp. NPDC058484 TaxID=3346524 RepID=UPI003653CE92